MMHEVKTKFLKGKVLHGRYNVEELLGQGGFGAVYRVQDRRVKGNVFALKEVVDPNRHQQENFLFEGEILRRLDHPALPRVYRVFEDGKNNRIYMLMDYIEGPNLEQLRLQQPEKRFSLPQALKMMAPVMEAVSYLHAQQPPIIHRDIKPANVIVSSLGEGSVLVDFGIAKEYDQDSTTAAIRHCSPGYGAPEQYVYGTSMQTDIYGLGATFYTLLTGEVPIDALYRITNLSGKKADPLMPANKVVPTIPTALADVLQRAMAINSSDRFATVQQFREALQAHVDEVQEPKPENRETSGGLLPAGEIPCHANEKVCSGPQTGDTGRKREPAMLLQIGLILLVLIALTSGVTMGSLSRWSGVKHGEPLRKTSLASSKSQPSASPPPPTAVENYPHMANSYAGAIHSSVKNMGATLALLQISQDGAHISGYYAVESSLTSNSYYSMQSSLMDNGGYFTGTVTLDNKIRFLIPSGDGNLPLFFEGQFQSDGGISGNYCSYRNNQCDHTSGSYGSWNVAPQAINLQTFVWP